jgi:hypothetical protein
MIYDRRNCCTTHGLQTPVGGRLLKLMGLPCELKLGVEYCEPWLGSGPCFSAKRCHSVGTIYLPCCCTPFSIGGLVRACRLLYAESASLLYTNTSFAFDCAHSFNVFCKAISLNQQFTPPPLMFIRDIRISVPEPHLQHIRHANAGLTLLAKKAVNLKRLELAVQQSRMYGQDTRSDIWYRERGRLLEKTLRILGSFRGLESFDLHLLSFLCIGHPLSGNETPMIARILRELVSQPKGSGTMTTRQFHNHFETRYQALMA